VKGGRLSASPACDYLSQVPCDLRRSRAGRVWPGYKNQRDSSTGCGSDVFWHERTPFAAGRPPSDLPWFAEAQPVGLLERDYGGSGISRAVQADRLDLLGDSLPTSLYCARGGDKGVEGRRLGDLRATLGIPRIERHWTFGPSRIRVCDLSL
jgi:hypothetical protein